MRRLITQMNGIFLLDFVQVIHFDLHIFVRKYEFTRVSNNVILVMVDKKWLRKQVVCVIIKLELLFVSKLQTVCGETNERNTCIS